MDYGEDRFELAVRYENDESEDREGDENPHRPGLHEHHGIRNRRAGKGRHSESDEKQKADGEGNEVRVFEDVVEGPQAFAEFFPRAVEKRGDGVERKRLRGRIRRRRKDFGIRADGERRGKQDSENREDEDGDGGQSFRQQERNGDARYERIRNRNQSVRYHDVPHSRLGG